MVGRDDVISLCLPTRGRAVRFRKAVESALRTATGEIEIVARVDSNDGQRGKYPQDLGVVYIEGPRPEHMSSLWNEAFDDTTGEIAMLAADDIIFETPGWDERVAEVFEEVPDRLVMVYADDGSDRKAPTHPFVSREWAELVGFTDGELPGWFADDAIWTLAAEIRRVVFLDDVMIRHLQRGTDKTYRDAAEARRKYGNLAGLRRRVYSKEAVARRDELVERLEDAKTSDVELIPEPLPRWLTESLEWASQARPAPEHVPNADTLVVIHCWSGDEQNVRDFLPYHRRHGRPILVLSPENAPVEIEEEGVSWHAAGLRGYFGQESLDRQRRHLEYLLTTPYEYFLLNDADSICLSPEIPAYLYHPSSRFTVFSNEVMEGRPHRSPYPKIAMQPPYFMHRDALERLVSVNVEAHPITPFVDWYMVALTCEAGLQHRKFPDGASFPAWRRDAIAETKQLGHDFHHEYNPRGRIQGDQLMLREVKRGKVFIHSVKHKPVMDTLIAAHDDLAGRSPPEIAMPKVSILVPFRPETDDDTRQRVWDWVMERWGWVLPDAEIVEGKDDGGVPFSKTTAVNDAALRASGDVFVVADADAWMEGDQLYRAIKLAATKHRLVVPWGTVRRIDQEGSAMLMDMDPRGPLPFDGLVCDISSPMPYTAGTLFVISRHAFGIVQGMDPRARGWGYEDVMFRRACDALLGKSLYQHMGIVYSLHHPRPMAEKRGRVWEGDEGRRNGELSNQYRNAERYPKMMRALCDQHPLGKEAMPIQPRPEREPTPGRSRPTKIKREEFTVHERIY